MQIDVIDLTSVYSQYVLGGHWTHYEQSYPALFQHYHRYWADVGTEYALQTAKELVERATLLKSRLLFIGEQLTKIGFADEVPVVLFVGKNTSNGHAFWDKQRHEFVVWLPVEAYTTTKQVDIFVTHELLHALHYTRHPEFYFDNEHQMRLIGRQIITEGLATFGTMQIIDCDEVTALWADYVSCGFARSWYDRCKSREREMVGKILKEWRTSQGKNEWFMMWDEEDVMRYRGGYYVGLRVMQEISSRHGLGLQDLILLNAKDLESLALKVVSELAMKEPA